MMSFLLYSHHLEGEDYFMHLSRPRLQYARISRFSIGEFYCLQLFISKASRMNA